MRNRFDLLTQQLFQKNISDCTVEELESLANQYPYFAPVQYALLKKLQQTESASYAAQLQKATLYYHNPPLFEQFISEEYDDFDSMDFPATGNEDLLMEGGEEPVIENSEPAILTEVPQVEESEVEPVMENRPEAEPEVAIEKPEELSAEDNPEVSEEEIKDEATPLNVSLPSLNEPVNNDAGTGLAFEPYHTVDYFASQGIKLSKEEATKDRFGRQLKSFTEWLKTMKKVPASEQLKPIDAASEQKVENLAAHSVDQAEIVTETMAEVWVKQGNHEKAIEIYNKLSLLNPSKRAYFAAKVDFLKKEI